MILANKHALLANQKYFNLFAKFYIRIANVWYICKYMWFANGSQHIHSSWFLIINFETKLNEEKLFIVWMKPWSFSILDLHITLVCSTRRKHLQATVPVKIGLDYYKSKFMSLQLICLITSIGGILLCSWPIIFTREVFAEPWCSWIINNVVAV